MSCNNDLKLIQALNSDTVRHFISAFQEEQDQIQTEDRLNKMVDENEKSIIIFKCGDGISVVSGVLRDISSPTEEHVENIPQELSTSFEIEVKPNMAEAIEKLREFHIKSIKDLKTDDIIIKQKYSQPPYREGLHSKDVVVLRRCRIRNRPNSGHGFKR